LTGLIVEDHGDNLRLQTRSGISVKANVSVAKKARLAANTAPGKAIELHGYLDKNNEFQADTVQRVPLQRY
jgi:hypothetical protein